ncbi:MAG: hypothetical protein ACK4YX_12200, partial [Rhabdaerophilum calidifontis]
HGRALRPGGRPARGELARLVLCRARAARLWPRAAADGSRAAEARASGRRFLRLYTSTDPNEAAAQGLYEAYGLRVVRMRRPLLWRLVGSRAALLYRERDLAAS